MRNPSRTDKLSGFSLPEIIDALTGEVTRARRVRPKIRVTEKTLFGAHALNAVLLWFLKQPEGKRNDILREGAALYVRHLASDEPVSVVLGLVADDGPASAEARGIGAVTRETGEPRKSKGSRLPFKKAD